jgi:hypothetical protein
MFIKGRVQASGDGRPHRYQSPTLLSATNLRPFHLGTASLLEGPTTDNAISLYRQKTRPNIRPQMSACDGNPLSDDRAGSEEAPEASAVSRD